MKTIRVIVIEKEGAYGYLSDYISELQNCIESVPKRYRKNIQIDQEIEEYYDGSYDMKTIIHYYRPMNKKELREDKEKREAIEVKQKTHEMKEYLRLKEKFK